MRYFVKAFFVQQAVGREGRDWMGACGGGETGDDRGEQGITPMTILI